MRRIVLFLSALLTFSATSSAQATGSALTPRPRGAGMEVRQYTLQVLSGSEAALLLTPFVPVGDGGGVWRSGSSVISVVGTKRTLAVADSVLKSYDHPPATLVLRFMLIAATDSAVTDPGIGEVEGELRRLLKFNGYRRLAEATSVVAETQGFTATMSAADRTEYTVDGGVKSVRDGRVGIGISLRSGTTGMMMGVPTSRDTRQLLSTALTIPLGQTVVLGTAAGDKGMAALILTVRPELAAQQSPAPAAGIGRASPSDTKTAGNVPASSEATYDFRLHYGSANFDGILRVHGDSMEVESSHGYCRADVQRASFEVKRFDCEGLQGVEDFVLAFDVHHVSDRSRWLGSVRQQQADGRLCIMYSSDPKQKNVCVMWEPKFKEVKRGIGDRIFMTPKPR